MSLEQALQENTAAVNRLADLLAAQQQPVVLKVETVPEIAKKAIEKAVENTAPVIKAAAETAVEVEQSSQARDELQDAETTEAKAAPTADDVKAALMAVAKKSRNDVQKILQHFGAANLSGLKADDYEQVIKMAEEALETTDA